MCPPPQGRSPMPVPTAAEPSLTAPTSAPTWGPTRAPSGTGAVPAPGPSPAWHCWHGTRTGGAVGQPEPPPNPGEGRGHCAVPCHTTPRQHNAPRKDWKAPRMSPAGHRSRLLHPNSSTAAPRAGGISWLCPPPVLWAPGRVLGFRLQSLKAELGAAGVSGEAVPDRCPAGIVSHQHQSTPQGPQNCPSTRAPPRDPKIVPVVRGLAGQDPPEHPPPHLASPAGATGSPRCPHKCVPAWPCAPKSGTQWLLGLGSVLWKGGGQA